MYDWNWSVEKKIETLAKEIYGAAAIDYTSQAKSDLKKITALGLDKLPVCVAKTQKSLSDNPKLLGRPKDFVVTVRQIEIAAGNRRINFDGLFHLSAISVFDTILFAWMHSELSVLPRSRQRGMGKTC